MNEETTLIREVAVSYRGARRKVASPLRFPADAARFVRRVVAGDSRDPAVANGNRRRRAAMAVEGQDVGIVENCVGRSSLRGHASAKPPAP